MDPQILIIARASPLRERTVGLLQSIAGQGVEKLVRIAVLCHRRRDKGPEFGLDGVEELAAESDWLGQAQSLARASGCRWVVFPSSVDRYLPGAFEAVAGLGRAPVAAVVGQCRIVRDGQPLRLGPDPFRFDYFALLSGFNYIAPGATFISVDHLLTSGGLDPRFSHAVTYEFLLRTGAAHGVESYEEPLVETEADPFPGVPAETSLMHATEAVAACLAYNGSFLAPGAALGLVAAIAARLGPVKHEGFYDELLVQALASAEDGLRDRYHEYLALAEGVPRSSHCAPAPTAAEAVEPDPSSADAAEPDPSPADAVESDPSPAPAAEPDLFPAPEVPEPVRLSVFSEEAPPAVVMPSPPSLRSRVRAVAPRPLWDLLRRTKRATKAFREPLL
jgi:hypothetical protein